MREVFAKLGEDIRLGRRGENLATRVTFDVSGWMSSGYGTIHLLHQRNGDNVPYPCAITVDGGTVTWEITAADVEIAGRGRAELQYLDGDVCKKSAIYTTNTLRALNKAGKVPPEPEEGWVHQVLELRDATESAARQAQESAGVAETSAGEAKTSAEYAADRALTAGACLLNTESYMQKAKAAQTAAEQSETNAAESARDAETSRERAANALSQAGTAAVQALNAAGRAETAAEQAGSGAVQSQSEANRAGQAAEQASLAADRAEAIVKDYQPDWDQNDSEGKGYIRNRPFYRLPPMPETGFETETNPDGTITSNHFREAAEFYGFYLEAGRDYTVVYDEAEYTCRSFAYEVGGKLDTLRFVGIGNADLTGDAPAGFGSDAPFFVCVNSFRVATIYCAAEGYHYIDVSSVVKLPNEYLDTDYIKETARAGANDIVCTASGEVVSVNDSAERPLRGLTLYGKTTQETTTGKNLLSKPINKEILNSGVSYIVNDDGSITANGTARDGGSFANISTVKLEVGKTYVLSGCPSTNNGGAALYFDGTSVFDRGSGATFQADKTDYVGVIMIPGGVTVSDLTFYPMVRLASITDSTYEPYTGGKPSPSPEYPQELESVGDDGTVGVTVAGKNLLKNTATTQTVNGVTFTVNADGSVTANGTCSGLFAQIVIGSMPCKANEKYVLSGCPSGGNSKTYWLLTSGAAGIDYGSSATFSYAEDRDSFSVVLRIEPGVVCNNLTFYPMVRLASIKDRTYEPYNAQTLTAQTPNGLHGIKLGATIPDVIANSPAHMSGVYWDEKTQAYWLCDTIDGASGKHVQRIRKFIPKNLPGGYEYNGYYLAEFAFDNPAMPVPNGVKADMMCDSLPIVTANYQFHNGGSNISIPDNGRGHITFEGAATLAEVNAKLAAQDITVMYILATPIETDLTAEELAQYAALRTNYPNTTVFNDSGAGMGVSYVADTKTYIDNKFAQLAAAMLNS